MKLTTITMVTVDGVMQGLGGADEDRRGGFERGGRVTLLFDDEATTLLNQVYQRADAFLFGRRTYEIFAGSWGAVEDPGISPAGATPGPDDSPVIEWERLLGRFTDLFSRPSSGLFLTLVTGLSALPRPPHRHPHGGRRGSGAAPPRSRAGCRRSATRGG
jgi:hypothetical protein